ncbi:hypothetical protein LZ655_27050, partial [Klebsiella pneumoniae]
GVAVGICISIRLTDITSCHDINRQRSRCRITIRIHYRVGKDIGLANSIRIASRLVGIAAVRMDRQLT